MLPRGCQAALEALLASDETSAVWKDERSRGRSIQVSFSGELRDEQKIAKEKMNAHENGILSATTAFGKTVIGAALIAEKKVNTLILVHRRQLLEQWKERLSQFLDIHEVLPETQKKQGRRKKREIIGTFGMGIDARSGIIDIAIMQSMCDTDTIQSWIGEYGMVIVDECHHVPAVRFEQVMKVIRAQYTYGLTATPTRKDGHHPILTMYLGDIRYRVDAKEQAEKRPFAHKLIPRFVGTKLQIDSEARTPSIVQYYDRIMEDDLRNHMIVDDVMNCAKGGRNCLLLSERTKHVEILADLLEKRTENVLVLTGGKTRAEAKAQMEKLKNAPKDKPLILCATGKYIGEGFDEARLDTLFLTMPISWKGTLVQYAGRLHRLHEGKSEVRIYDYIDVHAQMLEKMYQKRLKGYAAIGYSIALGEEGASEEGNLFFDERTYVDAFCRDIEQAKGSVWISSPYVSVGCVRRLESRLWQSIRQGVHIELVIPNMESKAESSAAGMRSAISLLKHIGVCVVESESAHMKCAVIDACTVWYGGVNLLGNNNSPERTMRLCSGGLASMLAEYISENTRD